MVRSTDHSGVEFAVDNLMYGVYQVVMLVRRLTMIILLILALTIPYVIGQWIDGDNLMFGLELSPFWIHGLRTCPAC